MFERVLIINRGEIALRIIRACKELNIKSILGYSDVDINSLPVTLADEAICIGPAPAIKSYLNYNQILAAAEICNVDAIHPGYGFLAENAEFAQICKTCNIEFIGPTSQQINIMGNKLLAKKYVQKIGIPTLSGNYDPIYSKNEIINIANKIGFPVIIKATLGGGGKGMRIAYDHTSLINGFHSARIEAKNAFNNSMIYIEKFIPNAKHIEVQIMADKYNNIIHLGQRECSLQRHHQKLIEEATPATLTQKIQHIINKDALKIAKKINYTNVGTIEFLVDEKLNHYFIEMNTRIQVEHTITEVITNIDIVKQQILLSAGKEINIEQKDISFNGHAIECRINAENPLNHFTPNCGKLDIFIPPGGPGIRIDTHCYNGYEITPFYDNMICKLIAYGKNRNEAIVKCKRALNEFQISGIKTNIQFLIYILSQKQFIDSTYNIQSVQKIITQFKNSNI